MGLFVTSSRDVGNHRSFLDHVKHPRTHEQLISTPALLVDSAHRNISLEDFGKSATVTVQ